MMLWEGQPFSFENF